MLECITNTQGQVVFFMDVNKKMIGEEAFKEHEHAWWDENGPYRLLHTLTPHRLSWMRLQWAKHQGYVDAEGLKRPWLDGVRVLDVGCGGGLLSEPLARQGAYVTGIDARAPHIEVARSHHDKHEKLHLVYQAQSLKDYAQCVEPESFDLIVAFEVIEHTTDPFAFLKQVNTLLKPGGLFVLSTINRTVASAVKAIGIAEYFLGWIPRGTHSWEAFITPDELKHLAQLLNWNVRCVDGLSYDLIRQSWQLHHNTDTNYFASFLKNV